MRRARGPAVLATVLVGAAAEAHAHVTGQVHSEPSSGWAYMVAIFSALVLTLAGLTYLIRQTLTEKPWLTEQGPVTDLRGRSAFSLPAAKLGLRVFLAVVTIVFSLLVVAYGDRMTFSDWHALPEPSVLWLNTVLLVAASIALQWARVAAARDRIEGVRIGLLAGGAFTAAFLVGQLVAWRELAALGYFAASNPAAAFFYLLTALHGLHMLGGLVAWGRTAAKVRRGLGASDVRPSVDLCAIYWHFLLLVWIVLFGLLLIT